MDLTKEGLSSLLSTWLTYNLLYAGSKNNLGKSGHVNMALNKWL